MNKEYLDIFQISLIFTLEHVPREYLCLKKPNNLYLMRSRQRQSLLIFNSRDIKQTLQKRKKEK